MIGQFAPGHLKAAERFRTDSHEALVLQIFQIFYGGIIGTRNDDCAITHPDLFTLARLQRGNTRCSKTCFQVCVVAGVCQRELNFAVTGGVAYTAQVKRYDFKVVSGNLRRQIIGRRRPAAQRLVMATMSQNTDANGCFIRGGIHPACQHRHCEQGKEKHREL